MIQTSTGHLIQALIWLARARLGFPFKSISIHATKSATFALPLKACGCKCPCLYKSSISQPWRRSVSFTTPSGLSRRNTSNVRLPAWVSEWRQRTRLGGTSGGSAKPVVRYGEQLADRRSLLSFNELIIQFIPADLMTVSAAGESMSVDVILAKGVWIRNAFLRQSVSVNHYKVIFLGIEISHYMRVYVVTQWGAAFGRTNTLLSLLQNLYLTVTICRSISATHIQEHSFTTQKYAEWSSLAHSARMGIFKGEETLKSAGDFKTVHMKKQLQFNKTETSLKAWWECIKKNNKEEMH